MAEIIGTAAAISQFIDVAVRLSSGIYRLCSEVRNVPRQFQSLHTDLRQQIEICRQIQADCLPAFVATVASPAFETLLFEYITLANELCQTLEKILANRRSGHVQRGWTGLCSIQKKESVLQICHQLEQRKSTLSVWLSAANL